MHSAADTPPTAPRPAADTPWYRSPWSANRVVLVVILGLALSAGIHLKLSRDKAVRDAETLLGAVAAAAEHHMGGTLAGMDALLDELAATVRDGRHGEERFTRDFQARLSSFPEIRFMGIANGDGTLQPQHWPPGHPPPDGPRLAGHAFFSAQRDATGPAAMLVGEPVYGTVNHERILHLSRPVRDKAGRFAGVVFAAVAPDVYAGFLSAILHDEAGRYSLISLSGRVVARAPAQADAYGSDVSASSLFRDWLPGTTAGIARVADDGDGRQVLLAYRVMPEFSLMVTAGLPFDRVLQEWRRMAAAELGLVAVFSGMLWYWAQRIRRHGALLRRQQHSLETAVRERSRELEEARTLAESRAARLGWINEELKRLTLVTSHHLQEPLRSIVSCGQMLPRALPQRQPDLDDAVADLTRQGVALKATLGEFETHVASLTQAVQQADSQQADSQQADSQQADGPPSAQSLPTAVPTGTGGGTYAARAVAAVIIAGLLAANIWQVRSDHRNSIQSAEALTTAVVRSIERHFQVSFRRLDILLADVTLAVESGRHHMPEFRDRLASRMETLPELLHVAVTDATGRVSQWHRARDGMVARAQDVGRHDFFQAQAAAPEHGRLVVGRPQADKVGGSRTLTLSHPVLAAGGRFDGIVFATVDADVYAGFLDALLLDENGGSAVITLDGHMVARAPHHEEKFASDISDSDLFTRFLRQAPAGIAHLVSKADGNVKLLGYRTIDGFPLVVTSGYSLAKALGRWQLVTAISSALAVMSSIVLFAWAWRADRHAQASTRYRHWLAEEVAQRTAGLAAAHDAAEQRARRLNLANGQMRDLIHMIAGQMQAPLRHLSERIGTVQALAGGRNAECDHWLGFMVAGGIHLRALLRDYQRFVAALSDEPRLRPLDSGEVARGAAGLIASVWGNRVRFDIGPLPPLMADRDMMLELFLQLFANSVIHAKEQPQVAVTVSAELRPEGWCFTVADDGPGLPPVNGEHLFRAFEAAHDRDPDSTGLGLPLCRVIVHWHGGRIWARSRAGKGCDIHFVMPDIGDQRGAVPGNPLQA